MKTREEINKTEEEIWNNRTLDRTKIKPLRRHAFHFSYKREKEIMANLVAKFEGKNVLEIGSYGWTVIIKGNVKPKKLNCINISQMELQHGRRQAEDVDFDTEFYLMDANNLTFPDDTFDAVFGVAILHHLDIHATMHHIHRVLKPGGTILFLEPLNMNPFYQFYRKLNPQERTPDEHALVKADFKIINKNFSIKHYFLDFWTVIFGYISLKIYGDKNYGNWLNKMASKLDVLTAKIPFAYPLFARVIIWGNKKNNTA